MYGLNALVPLINFNSTSVDDVLFKLFFNILPPDFALKNILDV